MVQKYQNEIPPIFYYGISTKTSEKDLKIPNLQALTLGRIIKITLYILWVKAHLALCLQCESTIWRFQQGEGPNRDLLYDCEYFADGSFAALLTTHLAQPPVAAT